jgi:hypothetical protein
MRGEATTLIALRLRGSRDEWANSYYSSNAQYQVLE